MYDIMYVMSRRQKKPGLFPDRAANLIPAASYFPMQLPA
jgi:hypothetical protein